MQMNESQRGECQEEIQELIEELRAKEMLSDEAQEKIDALLEEGRITKAGIIAIDRQSRRQTFAD